MLLLCIFVEFGIFDVAAVTAEGFRFVFVVVTQLLGSLFLYRLFDDAGGGVGGMACPIAVEILGNFGYDAAGGKNVEVSKDGVFTDFEIFVADVTPAEDGGAVVCGEGFVVHPAVETREVGQIAERAPFAADEGVKQADFDIGMAVESEQDVVQPVGVVVVQQQAHAPAAFGGTVDQVEHELAGDVVVPDASIGGLGVVGGFNQSGAGDEGFLCVVEQIDIGNVAAGFARGGIEQGIHAVGQNGCRGEWLSGRSSSEGAGRRNLSEKPEA